MSLVRVAFGLCVFAFAAAEVVHPTRWEAKRIGHATALSFRGAGLDTNVLDSLPPIDRLALGSIDTIAYELHGKSVPVTPRAEIPRTARIVLGGWCGDPEVRGVGGGAFLSVDRRERIDVSAAIGLDRPDVNAFYRAPGLERSGFRIVVDAARIGTGTHELQFGVIAHDRRGYFPLGGSLDLTIE